MGGGKLPKPRGHHHPVTEGQRCDLHRQRGTEGAPGGLREPELSVLLCFLQTRPTLALSFLMNWRGRGSEDLDKSSVKMICLQKTRTDFSKLRHKRKSITRICDSSQNWRADWRTRLGRGQKAGQLQSPAGRTASLVCQVEEVGSGGPANAGAQTASPSSFHSDRYPCLTGLPRSPAHPHLAKVNKDVWTDTSSKPHAARKR